MRLAKCLQIMKYICHNNCRDNWENIVIKSVNNIIVQSISTIFTHTIKLIVLTLLSIPINKFVENIQTIVIL